MQSIAPPHSSTNSNPGARIFVWSVWLAMFLMAISCVISYGRNIPRAEEWTLVAPLTWHQPSLSSFIQWLWQQENAHRLPLPKLILLAVLNIANGDFRAGMFLNVITMAGMSLVSILVAEYLRRGQSSYIDAFFPIVMLSLGNWLNIIWGWQFVQILPTALGLFFLLVLVCQPTLETARAAIIAGTCLVLFPLCGANGLLFVPLLIAWAIYCSATQLKHIETQKLPRWIPIFLLVAVLLSVILSILYLVNYNYSGASSSSGFAKAVETGAGFVASSFGTIAIKRELFKPFVFIAFSLYVPGIAILVLESLRHRDRERQRALAMLLFFGVFGLYTVFVTIRPYPDYLLPDWYSFFTIPFFATLFFTWELYGKSRWRRIFQKFLFMVVCTLLPLNMASGFAVGKWYNQGMVAVERNIAAGVSISELSQRNQKFLLSWENPTELSIKVEMLCENRTTPFSRNCLSSQDLPKQGKD